MYCYKTQRSRFIDDKDYTSAFEVPLFNTTFVFLGEQKSFCMSGIIPRSKREAKCIQIGE